MPRPIPTPALHFTHLRHLGTVADHGLLADIVAQARGLLTVEVGNRGIKEDRRRRVVKVQPGGVVADYAPFYYAPRSPMMSAIEHGRVPEYQDGCDRIIYLVTTTQVLMAGDNPVLITDRNAVLKFAKYGSGEEALDTLVDWPLMRATWWNNTPEDPDRRERRMAECLVHQSVPWAAFAGVVTKSEQVATEVRDILARRELETPVSVRRGWYF